MNDMTLKEASEKWGISVRRINCLCKEGRIPGATKRQNLWMIPASTTKPMDGRRKKTPLKEPGVLLRNTTYVETHADSDLCDYDKGICGITRLFLEGQMEEAFFRLKIFVNTCKDKQYLLIAYFILSYYSTFLADKTTKADAKSHIDKLLKDPDVGELTKALVQLKNDSQGKPMSVLLQTDEALRDEMYPFMSLEALRQLMIVSLKNNYIGAAVYHEIACRSLKDLPCPEVYVYYNILLSVYYTITGSDDYARMHLEEAARIALPRKWYTPFAQYALALRLDFIEGIDSQAYMSIQDLSEKILQNYIKLDLFSNGIVRSKAGDVDDLQVAYQIACGKTNIEIAEHLGKSVYQVKQNISSIYLRTGFTSRSEIREYTLTHIFL